MNRASDGLWPDFTPDMCLVGSKGEPDFCVLDAAGYRKFKTERIRLLFEPYRGLVVRRDADEQILKDITALLNEKTDVAGMYLVQHVVTAGDHAALVELLLELGQDPEVVNAFEPKPIAEASALTWCAVLDRMNCMKRLLVCAKGARRTVKHLKVELERMADSSEPAHQKIEEFLEIARVPGLPFGRLAKDFIPFALLNRMRRGAVTQLDLETVYQGKTAYQWLENHVVHGTKGKAERAREVITEMKYRFGVEEPTGSS